MPDHDGAEGAAGTPENAELVTAFDVEVLGMTSGWLRQAARRPKKATPHPRIDRIANRYPAEIATRRPKSNEARAERSARLLLFSDSKGISLAIYPCVELELVCPLWLLCR